jgi:hypothetical protein
MPDRRNEDNEDRKPKTDHSAGGGGAPLNQHPPQAPVKTQSQKSQIAQYFKSQGKQPDDVIWSTGGMNLTLKDLDG